MLGDRVPDPTRRTDRFPILLPQRLKQNENGSHMKGYSMTRKTATICLYKHNALRIL